MQKKHFQHIIIISIVVFSLASINLNGSSRIDVNHISSNENALNMNSLTKDNFTQILPSNKHSLGNITLDDISYLAHISGLFNENVYHPLVTEDFSSFSLMALTTYTNFIEAKSPASINYIDDERITDNFAVYTFNETLKVWYNKIILKDYEKTLLEQTVKKELLSLLNREQMC